MGAATEKAIVNLRLPPDVRDRLRDVAHDERRSLSNMIAVALEEWLIQREKAVA